MKQKWFTLKTDHNVNRNTQGTRYELTPYKMFVSCLPILCKVGKNVQQALSDMKVFFIHDKLFASNNVGEHIESVISMWHP